MALRGQREVDINRKTGCLDACSRANAEGPMIASKSGYIDSGGRENGCWRSATDPGVSAVRGALADDRFYAVRQRLEERLAGRTRPGRSPRRSTTAPEPMQRAI
jgi:hypothetical protein